MRASTQTGLALAASIAVLVLPAAAWAEYLVPPGNSAATQYTESVPTAGGHRNTELDGGGAQRAPSRVLGKRNSERLEAQGKSGEEAAGFAAETAPAAVVAEERTTPPQSPGHNSESDDEDVTAGAGTGNEGPPGRGAVGQVAAQATGATSGELGLWLPLAMLATALWAAAVVLRRRLPTDPQP
ncbi:MAG TPA: hypothetical protein VFC52_01455 [Solirubrobacterales bacterium]|nr:hypothetical protein [Solirubrobacterales bacterium]